MKEPEVVGLGAMNMDLLYIVEQVLLDGEAFIDKYSSNPGGSAANTIYGLARLGVNASFVGAVGTDSDGQNLIDDLQRAGVDTKNIVRKEGASTGKALCLSDKSGVRSLYILPGANARLSWQDVDLGYLNQARLLHFSSFTNEAQLDIQRRVAHQLPVSVQLSFSPGALYASRGIEALAPILERTSILFLNQVELRQLTGDDLHEGAVTCLRQGCHIVVVTLGSGVAPEEIQSLLPSPPPEKMMLAAYIADGRQELIIETKRIPAWEIEDTTGAGDAFTAGFIFGFLRGKDLVECGLLGDTVAKLSIRKIGARSGLPTLPELAAKYQEWYGRDL